MSNTNITTHHSSNPHHDPANDSTTITIPWYLQQVTRMLQERPGLHKLFHNGSVPHVCDVLKDRLHDINDNCHEIEEFGGSLSFLLDSASFDDDLDRVDYELYIEESEFHGEAVAGMFYGLGILMDLLRSIASVHPDTEAMVEDIGRLMEDVGETVERLRRKVDRWRDEGRE